jgi:hypothetical protein
VLKDGAVFIHHGPTKQRSSMGSGGADIVLSREAVRDWKKGGEVQVADSVCEDKTTRFILIELKIIKSNKKCYNTL